jgi:hypothetical protein
MNYRKGDFSSAMAKHLHQMSSVFVFVGLSWTLENVSGKKRSFNNFRCCRQDKFHKTWIRIALIVRNRRAFSEFDWILRHACTLEAKRTRLTTSGRAHNHKCARTTGAVGRASCAWARLSGRSSPLILQKRCSSRCHPKRCLYF